MQPTRHTRAINGRRTRHIGSDCSVCFPAAASYDRNMSRVRLLSVPIDPVTASEAVSNILVMLEGERQYHLMTPNAEMLVHAARSASFRDLLKRSDLNLPDSVSLLYAAKWTRQRLPERVTGVDTVSALCSKLDQRHPVFLLGAAPGIAGRAAVELQDRNPNLEIAGTYAGSPKEDDASAMVELINRSGAHILLVAYGAPAQDEWIDRHLKDMPSIRVAMGVGGTFDFLAGTAKRAPSLLRSLGLEWFWRLIREPRRFPRIIRAVLVFPLLVLWHGQNLRGDLQPN